MRHAHDTFLHFLADNLAIPVKELRREPNRPGQMELAMNTLNVKFINVVPDPWVSGLQVLLDIVNDDQLVAMSWVEQVYTVLSAAFMTPLYDYSAVATGGQPVLTGGNIFWKRQVRFIPVRADYYYHYSATLTLYHH